jgi:hypothetical protein
MQRTLKLALLPVALAALFLVATALQHSASARVGLTGCTVSKRGHLWDYLISGNVPPDTTCHVYIWQDTPEGGWDRCWQESTNFDKKKCPDLINNKAFSGWKAQARCNGKVYTLRCNR